MTTSLIVECGRLCMQKLISVDVLNNSIALNVQAHSKIPLSPRARIWKISNVYIKSYRYFERKWLNTPTTPSQMD